ncbi:ABC transporter substrate-binding protein [Eubacteriales bacterium OttesenSCG-928-K08]|nr:ABC transporter substrate-binding protein [Eubacteriales bacterium OttesenSCG-928-K08]
MKKISRLIALCLAFGLMTGCTVGAPDVDSSDPTPDGGAVVQEPQHEAPSEPKIIKTIAHGEDNSINHHEANTLGNTEIIDYIHTGLYQWAPAETRDKALLIPSLAEGEPTTQDGLVWIIKVNKDAKWSNGEPIDANTFIYSWSMCLDPKLAYQSGSFLATQYITVENGVAYYEQLSEGKEAVDWADVGFKALDDYTLEITTTQKYTVSEVMRHFSIRYSWPVYEPLYEAGMNSDRSGTNYGTALEYYMGCGPFNLTTWVKASERVYERNPNYINAHLVHLDGVQTRVVSDEATCLEMFDSGELDYTRIGANGLEKYGEAPQLEIYAQTPVRTIEFNYNHPEYEFLSDPLFRKAVYFGVDRQTVAKLTNSTPAQYFLSTTGVSFADGTRYRQMEAANSWLPENYGYNPELAKQYFDEVLAKYGLDKITLSLLYYSDIENLRIASEYLQGQLPQVFGADRFELTLQSMQTSAAWELMRTSTAGPTDAWDLGWTGWNLSAEQFEPYKKFAPYRSTASNRYSNYTNTFVDENYPSLLSEEYRLDEQKLFELTVEVEKSIILDDTTCVPVFQDRAYALLSDRVWLSTDGYVPQLGFGLRFSDVV